MEVGVFETMVDTTTCAVLCRGIIIPGFLGWCMDILFQFGPKNGFDVTVGNPLKPTKLGTLNKTRLERDMLLVLRSCVADISDKPKSMLPSAFTNTQTAIVSLIVSQGPTTTTQYVCDIKQFSCLACLEG